MHFFVFIGENKLTYLISSPLVACILEGLGLCLTCKNSIFEDTNFLQTDATAQGTHMSESYNDIAMSKFNTASLQYHLQSTLWERF